MGIGDGNPIPPRSWGSGGPPLKYDDNPNHRYQTGPGIEPETFGLADEGSTTELTLLLYIPEALGCILAIMVLCTTTPHPNEAIMCKRYHVRRCVWNQLIFSCNVPPLSGDRFKIEIGKTTLQQATTNVKSRVGTRNTILSVS